MSLEVTFRNLRPRDEIRRRGEALYAKLERFLDSASTASLVVAVEAGAPAVELTVTSRGHTYTADERDDELRTALDRLFHNVEEQLRRAKDRRVSQRRPGERADGFEDADA